MRISQFVISIVVSVTLPVALQANKDFSQIGIPKVEYYEPKDYNSGMQNNYITQDARGIVYVANNYGLLEFDGSSWNSYPVLTGTKVRSIAISEDGIIYVGAQNQFGYFSPEPNGRLQYHSLSEALADDQLKIDEVWDTYVLGDQIIFTSFEHLHILESGNLTSVKAPGRIENTFLINNQLIVQIINEGLFQVSRGKFDRMKGFEPLANVRISSLIPFSKKRILVATFDHGIFTYNGSELAPWGSGTLTVLKNSIINDALLISSNELVIGTRNKGIFILSLEGNIISNFNKLNGFNNRDILDLMEDDYGNIWVGQNSGLAKIEYSSPFTFINENSGIEGAGYCGYQNELGLFLGTNNGLYLFARDDVRSQPLQLLQGQTYSISELNGAIFIGHDRGTYIYKSGEIEQISQGAGSWDFMIPDENEDLIIEGNYYGFAKYSGKQAHSYERAQIVGLNESSRVFEEEEDGSIWMTHGYKGVYRLFPSSDYSKFDSIRFYDQNDGFATNQLINVFRINGQLVFCSGQGIYQYDDSKDRFLLHEKFTKILGLDVHIRYLEENGSGDIYYISSNHSGILRKDRFGNYSDEPGIFKQVHEQLNNDLESIYAGDLNNTLFGAQNGFIVYNSNKFIRNERPIQTLIRNMTSTNDGAVLFAGNFFDNSAILMDQPKSALQRLDYKNNSVLFNYSCTYTSDPKNTKYQYFLKGYDAAWSDWSNHTEKEYTNLREGDYTFQARSKTSNGAISDIASFKFYISPPWYRTTLAYIGYFMATVSIVFGILFTQNTRHNYEKKALTLQQKRELIKKDNEFVQLSEKSKAEIIKLENEKLEMDINSKNKELASTTMNLIDKNQLLSGLKGDLEQALNKDDRLTKKSLRDMIKKIDHSISHDDEWKRFQLYFDQVHGDFSQRLRETFGGLSPQEVKLSTYLRMNLSTKEIAQLMNITTRGVEIARYRLRKKLDLTRENNLTEFISRF